MRSMIWLFGWMLIAGQPLFADSTEAVFASVDGDVKVVLAAGQKPVAAQPDMTVPEGARVITRAASSAVLRLFDGSELTVSPQTELQLTQLQRPTPKDKAFHFDLFIGGLEAVVKALKTSRSTFEIESGGIVCAVRGTKYKVELDAKLRKMLVDVQEGKVSLHQPGKPDDLVKAGEHRLLNDIHIVAPRGENLKKLSDEVGEAPVTVAPNGPLNDPALQSMIQNSQAVHQTNQTNLVHTIQQNSSVNVHVGPGETVP